MKGLSRRASVAFGAVFATSLMAFSGAQAIAAPQEGGVRDVDWHAATFEVPEIGPCPQQVVEFADGEAHLPDHLYRFTPERDIVFADVTGDGTEDALMLVECGVPNSEYTRALIGMTADPEVRLLGAVESPPTWTRVPDDIGVEPHEDLGQIVTANITDFETDRTYEKRYTWSDYYNAFLSLNG
ncbi:hypothetical protein BAY61_04840 [Prauserella marina]|uniref:Uncharacterized protein n=1 Tax=Prauserella marina TaxID=530584 RepID=A0A222VKK0_9PSEU|nr:hypothetical protein [Prauserella marina]ASR34427.1 hypothetical protein BAY61_04840 [Prauserella marina]PWV70983.1 hypothetical protein DES30_11337 [Prauserella marina]SDE00235.1 hypothetical protein SAMN05421630_11630 [Prauserella marina]